MRARARARTHAHTHTHTHTHIKIMCSSRLFIENCSSISEMKVPHNHTIHELLFLFHNRSFMRCMASSCQEIIKTILRCLRTRYLLDIQDNVIRFFKLFHCSVFGESPQECDRPLFHFYSAKLSHKTRKSTFKHFSLPTSKRVSIGEIQT